MNAQWPRLAVSRQRQTVRGGGVGGASARHTARFKNSLHCAFPPTGIGGAFTSSIITSLTSSIAFNAGNSGCDCLSCFCAASIAVHIPHGWSPSKVVVTALTTPALCVRSTSIPVHAATCKIAQCAPLRCSAQATRRSLWSGAFNLRRSYSVRLPRVKATDFPPSGSALAITICK